MKLLRFSIGCLLLIIGSYACDRIEPILSGNNGQKTIKDKNREKCEGSGMAFNTILRGSNSSIKQDQNRVIDDDREWQQLLQQLKGNKSKFPDMDFSKNLLIGVFQGQKPTSGYGISVKKICKSPNQLNVHVENKEPEQGCPVNQTFSRPFHLVKISRPSHQNIQFQENQVKECASKGKKPQCPNPVNYTPIDKGSHSGIREAKQVAIKNQQEWSELTKKSDLSNLPNVNFQKKMVLAVFQGSKPTGGYSVKVADVCKTQSKTRVEIVSKKPGKNCVVTQALTTPYEMVIIPKIKQQIAFSSESQSKRCH